MSNPDSRPGLLRRLWHGFWSPWYAIAGGSVIIIGFIAGIIFWGGFNWSMELTNNLDFCITCHEMEENVYVEYRDTIHYTNRTGVRATCPDCHVPKEWIHKVVRKIYASNELYHHFMGDVSTPEKFNAKRLELATHVWRAMKTTDSRECRNCHDFRSMDLSKQENRASTLHQEALASGRTCIDCHRGVAHKLPAGADDAMRALYEELGYPLPGDADYSQSAAPASQ
jgi:cytochrome c-type protein NapC